MAENWYALWVKPHKENTVLRIVESQNIDAFMPMVKVKPKNPRAAKIRPYFPGYMFIRSDLDALGANYFNWMVGAHGLVSFGNDPVVIPPNLINELKDTIAQIEAAGGVVNQQFKQGDKVRITSGPFAGYDAMFDMTLRGNERVQVLLAFLSNYQQPLQLAASDIEKR